MDTQNYGSVCLKHKEAYTNICVNVKCMTPLCPDCITTHGKSHQFSQIISLKECKINSMNKLQNAIEHCTSLRKNPQLQAVEQLDLMIQLSQKKVQLIKEKLLMQVEEYFKKLSAQIQNEIVIIAKNPYMIEFHKRILSLNNQLDSLSSSVNTNDKNQINAFRKVYNLDTEMLISKTNEETSKMLDDIKYPSIAVHTNVQNEIEDQLKKLVYIDLMQIVQTRRSEESSMIRSSLRKEKDQLLIQQSNSPIHYQDYFNKNCEFKMLHFFKYNSNELYQLSLPILHYSKDVQFERIIIKQSIRVPIFHQSVITPNGQIYLLGGTIGNQHYPSEKSDIIYQYDEGRNILRHVGKMLIGRSSFGCCVKDQYIYSLSGLTEELKETNKCERFDIKSKKSEDISDCLFAYIGANCILFNDFIYKISENHIERYSIRTDVWLLIDPTIDMKGQDFKGFSQYACGVQISQNDLLLFGGYQNDIGQDNTYQIQQAGSNIPHISYQDKPLPLKEGFWNNQAILYDNVIYSLQNVEVDGEISLNQRKVLKFSGQWEVLN